MPDLVAFLEARYAEDEAIVRAVEGHQLFDGTGIIVMRTHLEIHTRSVTLPSHVATYATQFDPARMLAEIASKRLIVDAAFRYLAEFDNRIGCGHTAAQLKAGECPEQDDDIELLLILAAPYADHPDYDPRWTI